MNIFETKILKKVTAQVEFFRNTVMEVQWSRRGRGNKKLLMERILGGISWPVIAAEAK